WQRSVCLRKIGKYTQALVDLKKAQQLDSNNYKVYCELGTVYVMLENFALAEKNYEKCISINPDYSQVYNSRGAYKYQYVENKESAFDDYTRAIALNPTSHYAYYNRGIIYREREEFTNAIKDLSQSIKLNPKDHQTHYERGRCYSSIKDFSS